MRPRQHPDRHTAHRFTIGGLVLSALMALALLSGLPSPAGATPSAVTAATPATKSAVVSGKARFEVLSPTLIRTEYAGDESFVDAATFNAIGRDGFAKTPFETSTVDGWLTITTSAVTLRYKVGSGRFSTDNLQVDLRAGKQDVTARPWSATANPTCEIGVLCEAETTHLAGPTQASDHSGYTGRGFAAGFEHSGDSLSFDVTVADAGTYDFDARYANATGGDGQNTTRTLSVTVDQGSAETLTLPSTGSWDTWKVATASVSLPAGKHTITLARTASDSGNVNVDSLALVKPGSAYPAPTAPKPLPCAYGVVCEAETSALAGGAKLASDHNGYSGAGFVGGLEKTSASVAATVTDVPKAGTYDVQLRYANAKAGAQAVQSRTMSVQVNDAAPSTVSLAPTSSWDTWRTVSAEVSLPAGTSTLTLGCPDASSCNVNLDTIAVTRHDAELLAPHAALGGYRRGLDGVNGGAITAPGLLYQDGWSLLDDTASAIYDETTHKVTQRPSHGDAAYQDGYVFAYGHDYPGALRDLATLTGPTALLPRWTYGVWYAEYYDRTAADFQQTIIPKFRSEGVPLDVLVTDTDFKVPNQWNGWEIDKSKFPDPEAFFDWAHKEGLHSSLNIHPSILASDPQFAKAQETAKGKLQPGSCSGGGKDCYVFDFGDSDQLKAYLGLHRTMEQQGVDFWWLDWCCDASNSSLAGVTADAWINQQYADDTAPRVGRGFAFSRAYGSLQAGGYGNPVAVPTGPWADKRTTLHFTGDTTSNWETLKFEVGYTGGESAATGLAAVSHDIGGHTGGLQEPGTEPGSTKLPDDLYARWVQLGTFQPIDRLHSNHSDRLPWQYGPAAKASAEKFLNLRENLMPYTYSLAEAAHRTGLPMVRPLYLAYPEQQESYANADGEYLYGPDVLVAPATDPGTTTTTNVWFPAGSSWTDYFTGKTYDGGTTAKITTGLDTMPVFIRSGGLVTTRTSDVTNDDQNPLTKATVTVAEGAAGSTSLYEDNGTTTDTSQRTTTAVHYRRSGANHIVTIDPARGGFTEQVKERTWTVKFLNATEPQAVSINGRPLGRSAWAWDASTRSVTVHAPKQSTGKPLLVRYR
ncbi:MAG TPA: TIM-barrel domain-containing protein [Flexivirga sp.]|uniref:TIM-barrel domain-containing protein n=1 Tax=Flexivirga sp. TaxID=1962927 RepID=UPI002C430584|nr:TIM-barrel domain-containing protein [Flexivirga sp.]HWC24623.1 TIM-barrel domain-containing protein [Flexivirga sp.]